MTVTPGANDRYGRVLSRGRLWTRDNVANVVRLTRGWCQSAMANGRMVVLPTIRTLYRARMETTGMACNPPEVRLGMFLLALLGTSAVHAASALAQTPTYLLLPGSKLAREYPGRTLARVDRPSGGGLAQNSPNAVHLAQPVPQLVPGRAGQGRHSSSAGARRTRTHQSLHARRSPPSVPVRLPDSASEPVQPSDRR